MGKLFLLPTSFLIRTSSFFVSLLFHLLRLDLFIFRFAFKYFLFFLFFAQRDSLRAVGIDHIPDQQIIIKLYSSLCCFYFLLLWNFEIQLSRSIFWRIDLVIFCYVIPYPYVLFSNYLFFFSLKT